MPERIKYRLHDFEVTPPSAAWDTIAARLQDDAKHAELASRLNQYEVPPPDSLWSGIARELDKIEEAPKSIRKTILYRLSAAAIVIGIIATGYWWMNRKAAENNLATVSVNKSIPQPSLDQTTDKKTPVTSQPETNNTDEETNVKTNTRTGDNSTNAQSSIDDRGILRYATISAVPNYNEQTIVINSAPIKDENGAIIRDMDVLTTNNSYLMIAGPDGQMTRISSKFANVIRFLNGGTDDTEEYLDKVIKESGIWKQRFKEWRQKIIESRFIPASTNFLDIIEFKDLIEEHQQ